jgi:hypothetical protein
MSNRIGRKQGRSAGGKRAGEGFAVDQLEARVLMATDPVTPDNPIWFALPGEAVVDGVLNDAAWAGAFTTVRTAPYKPNSSITYKMLAGVSGMFVGFDVKDEYIWADGRGTNVAFHWEVEQDDSMTVYFDTNSSAEELFQPTDFALGIGLGNPESGVIGTGALKRYKWVKGNATDPGTPLSVNPDNSVSAGMTWKTVINGTVNSGSVLSPTTSDKDVGWTTEMFFPWTVLGFTTRPTNGASIGMNFEVIFDDDGGLRDAADYRGGADRWSKPHFIDDVVAGVQSSYNDSAAGLRGPINYAQVVFVDPLANSTPTKITDLVSANATGYGGLLKFTAPATVAGSLGGVAGYEIRYSTSAINDETTWTNATLFESAYVPKQQGQAETLRVLGLSPATNYHFAVRSVNAAGQQGPISNDALLTTQSALVDVSNGRRVYASPMGRTLVKENGTAFVPVGDHLGLPWNFARSLYPGDIWDAANNQFVNFNQNLPYEGSADPYFDLLQARGVNTMRVYIELQGYNWNESLRAGLPRGTYSLEYQAGVFNQLMKGFMLNVLREATERGIYVIFATNDTYTYDDTFSTEFPYSTVNGGPLTNINDFFQNSQVLDLTKTRYQTLVSWMNETPFKQYKDNVLGWEPMSEWDSIWTNNAEGNFNPSATYLFNNAGREIEYRRRSVWMEDLGKYIKSIDPNTMLLNSPITRDARGPVARQLFYSRTYDLLTPHYYTISNSEPINNPDTDRTVRPAIENGQLTQWWLVNVNTRIPIVNGEWGNSRVEWVAAGKGNPAYQTGYTQATDEAITRTMMWSGLASGQAGMGLRISTDELNFNTIPGDPTSNNGLILTANMRQLQKTFSNFVNSSTLAIDWRDYNFDALAGRLSSTSAAGKRLLSWGTSDGDQGVLYVLQDTRSTTGSVTDGVVTINGLTPDSSFDIEFWSTAIGTTAPLSSTNVFSPRGVLTFNLPSFATDVAVKFKSRAAAGTTQRIVSVSNDTQLLTFTLNGARQPVVSIRDTATGSTTTQYIAAIAGFTGRLNDITPFVWAGSVHLAATDENHHLHLFTGNPAAGTWTVTDLTALIDAPGITGDLSHYSPSWGAIHIAGLDARGHAINYWYAPGQTTWQFSDLTSLFNGPIMSSGLTGYVTGWDGLNVAGLNSSGEVIVYWWAPGLTNWQTLNMTTTFSGSTLTGQLDAWVTPWGALNIGGLTADGDVYTYWWSPTLGSTAPWQTANLTTAAAGTPKFTRGVEVGVGSDGSMNIFGLDAQDNLRLVRWVPNTDGLWKGSNVTSLSGGPVVSSPLGSSSANGSLLLGGRSLGATRTLQLFTYNLTGAAWTTLDTGLSVEV